MLSRHNLAQAITDEYEATCLRFVSTLKNIWGHTFLSLDRWSSRVPRVIFLTTFYSIRHCWNLKCAVLELRCFLVHNQCTTSEFLLEVIEQYNYHNKLVATTTDPVTEMPSAMRSVKNYLNQDYADGPTSDYRVSFVCHIIISQAVADASALITSELEKP